MLNEAVPTHDKCPRAEAHHAAAGRAIHEETTRSPFRRRVRLDAVEIFGAFDRPALVAAVPARDEADALPSSLDALEEALAGRRAPAVVIVVNNSADGSAAAARHWARAARIPAVVCTVRLAAGSADVGHARRLALEIAASTARPDAVLLTTDADTRVAPGWADALSDAVRDGAALAYGRIVDENTVFASARARQIACTERRLAHAQAVLWRRIVPEAPQSLGLRVGGANLAVAARAYRAVGGLPPLPVEEDRALARRMVDANERVAFAPGARVATSMRLDGRVCGGMAQTLAARSRGDDRCDSALLPTRAFVLRALAFRADRLGCRATAAVLSARLPRSARDWPGSATVRRCWQVTLEALDPIQPLRLAEAEHEARRAEAVARALGRAAPDVPSAAAVLRATEAQHG